MGSGRDSTAGNQDLEGAEARWGGAGGRTAFRASDLRRLSARLPFALRLARAAASDPVAFRITVAAVRRHRALQKPLELFEYLRLVKRRRPARVLEIGTLWGGTFYAHCAVAQPHGHLIAMDCFPRENAARMRAHFGTLARAGQTVTCVWEDSHSDAAVQAVERALGGASLDLLFIDGDHSAEGVRRDYATYSAFVRAGGAIAFHDIDAGEESGVARFWRTLRRSRDVVEFVDRAHPPAGLGIGVVVK